MVTAEEQTGKKETSTAGIEGIGMVGIFLPLSASEKQRKTVSGGQIIKGTLNAILRLKR